MSKTVDYSNWKDADAIEAFNALRDRMVNEQGLSPAIASGRIQKKNPALHRRYLEATQTTTRAKLAVRDGAA